MPASTILTEVYYFTPSGISGLFLQLVMALTHLNLPWSTARFKRYYFAAELSLPSLLNMPGYNAVGH